MFAEVTRQCGFCRSHISIEKRSEVKDVVIDGRRHLSCICPVCGEVHEICVRMVPKEEKR